MGGARSNVLVGLLMGGAFVVHALFENTHAWPLIWSVVGGLGAAFLAKSGAVGGLKAGAAAGLTAALVIVLVGAPAIMLLVGDAIAERAAELNLPFEGLGFVLLAMAVLGLINLVLSALTGLVMGAVTPKRG